MKNAIIRWINVQTARFQVLNRIRQRKVVVYTTMILLMLLTALVIFSDSDIGQRSIGAISIPMISGTNEQTMTQEQLIPIGKMKGEIDGQFDSFYVAVDKQARIFINRDIEYGPNAYKQSNHWELISKAKLSEYERELTFLPINQKSKSLKP